MPEKYTVTEMLDKLVSFQTVSDLSNLGLIEFVKDYLEGYGIQSKLLFDSTGKKASLHALVGPNVAGGVVLSAHTDVVPVEDQHWKSDPFKLEERKGKFYGRGAVDMKGFAACVLASVPKMLSSGLIRPVHIALSYDEEIGCLGAPPMIDQMLIDQPKPMAVIVGEPSNMKVVTAQKGIIVLKTEVEGHSVHSSQLDRGISAITISAKLINWLDQQTKANAKKANPDSLFSPPYTTLHCGIFNGGTAHNIVAGSASFEIDIRTIPGEDHINWHSRYTDYIDKNIMRELPNIDAKTNILVSKLADVPGLIPETNGVADTLCRQLTGDNSLNGVVYATEAGQFQERGLSAVICGPGSIDQAHQPDEFISGEELQKCEQFLDRLYKKLAS